MDQTQTHTTVDDRTIHAQQTHAHTQLYPEIEDGRSVIVIALGCIVGVVCV